MGGKNNRERELENYLLVARNRRLRETGQYFESSIVVGAN
jgi:hypothetical protein